MTNPGGQVGCLLFFQTKKVYKKRNYLLQTYVLNGIITNVIQILFKNLRRKLKMKEDYVNKYIKEKITSGDDFLRFSFYELRVKENLSNDDTDDFLEMAKWKLEDIGYDVYFSGAKYTYKGNRYMVGDNELMIAIKSE